VKALPSKMIFGVSHKTILSFFRQTFTFLLLVFLIIAGFAGFLDFVFGETQIIVCNQSGIL